MKKKNSIYKTINFIHAFGRLRFFSFPEKPVTLIKRDSFQIVINNLTRSLINFCLFEKHAGKLWKFITQMTPTTTWTISIIYTITGDKRERWRSFTEQRRKNTKAPMRTFSRFPRKTHSVDIRVWADDGKSLHGVCVNVALSPLLSCVFFIWRIYGDFYHKYFAMLILFAIV